MLQENFNGLFKGLKNNIYVYKWHRSLPRYRLRNLEDSSKKIQIIIQESLSKTIIQEQLKGGFLFTTKSISWLPKLNLIKYASRIRLKDSNYIGSKCCLL